jgi:predicted metal-binding membrane protein
MRTLGEGEVGRGSWLLRLGIALALGTAWAYVLWMEWGMRHMDVGAQMLIMPRMVHWDSIDLGLVFFMWAVMMAAMMLPSAWPAVRAAAGSTRESGRVALDGWSFAAGYLAAWVIFSAGATLLHWVLLEAALITPTMQSASRVLSGALLVGAGLYQFTLFKGACLRRCRLPLSLLLLPPRSAGAAVASGFSQGLSCLGCCWALMLLLFAGGVMNLYWIVGLTAYVLVERRAPGALWVRQTAGIVLVLWGIYLLGAR